MIEPPLKGYGQNTHCAYHMDTLGHDTNNCWAIRYKLQDLIDNGTIAIAPLATKNIGANPCILMLSDPQAPPSAWS